MSEREDPSGRHRLEPLCAAVRRALRIAGASAENADIVADALVRAEAEGNTVCGLVYLPIMCDLMRSGRLDGTAVPIVSRNAPSSVTVDAKQGFALPAIRAGQPVLIEAAVETGMAGMAVRHSSNALSLSHIVEPIAETGLLAFAFANAPASIAPPGGNRPLIGTNPLAMGVPGKGGPALILDQSASAVTKTKIMMARDRGEEIPLGWAVGPDGVPTTDPATALSGSITPSGGHKGFGIGLIVEVLAVALTGANASRDAAPFFGTDGPPTDTGQFVFAIDPARFATGFIQRIQDLVMEMSGGGNVRVPGERRRENLHRAFREGLALTADQAEMIWKLGGG